MYAGIEHFSIMHFILFLFLISKFIIIQSPTGCHKVMNVPKLTFKAHRGAMKYN